MIFRKDYTCLSGSAPGADTKWENSSKEFGCNVKSFSFEGHQKKKIRIILTQVELNVADTLLDSVNKLILKRTFPTSNEFVNNLLRRNFYQIKDSGGVYALSGIPNLKSKYPIVYGGTAWAVAMAYSKMIPIYIFDTSRKSWYRWVYDESMFFPMGTVIPTLSKNFTGIGSRDIDDQDKEAIDNVFINTFPDGRIN